MDTPKHWYDIPLAIARGFVALHWYDGLIEFLFRFVAMTSEPLLAAGIVYAAAVQLSHNHIGGNINIQDTWAWTQALAIESSSGVVLVYGLMSLKERDSIKAKLYLVLAVLLAITGGVMLFMQMSAIDGLDGNPWMRALFGLRCLVSIGYIGLCRTKRIRFSGFTSEPGETVRQASETTAAISDETVQHILARLSKLDEIERALSQQVVSVSPVDVPRIAAPKTKRVSRAVRETAKAKSETVSETDIDTQLAELLKLEPTISVSNAASRLGQPRSTVGRKLTRMRQQ